MLVRSKFLPQFVEKIEKLKLSLSKQHNKMLKIRSERLKIIKTVKMIKLGKIFRIPGIPRVFGITGNFPEFPGISRDRKIFKMIFRFPGS